MKKIKKELSTKQSSAIHQSHHFIVPIKYYLFTLVSLIILTATTVYTATMWDLPGYFNITLAISIAVLKATLVILFFMGLHWDRGLNLAFLLGTLFFITVFVVITLLDYASRSWINPWGETLHSIESPVKPSKENHQQEGH